MVDYTLWYCVEGKDAINKIIISDGKDVADLKEEIHKKCSHSYWNGVEAMELVLLKVCHLGILCCCSNQRSE